MSRSRAAFGESHESLCSPKLEIALVGAALLVSGCSGAPETIRTGDPDAATD